MPVIAAGQLATPEIAGRVLAEQKADLVGLARVILADGDWVRKAQRGEPVVTCDPTCHHVCEDRVSRGLPAICPRWPQERFQLFTLGALRSYSPLRRSYHCLQIFNLPLQTAHPARLLLIPILIRYTTAARRQAREVVRCNVPWTSPCIGRPLIRRQTPLSRPLTARVSPLPWCPRWCGQSRRRIRLGSR